MLICAYSQLHPAPKYIHRNNCPPSHTATVASSMASINCAFLCMQSAPKFIYRNNCPPSHTTTVASSMASINCAFLCMQSAPKFIYRNNCPPSHTATVASSTASISRSEHLPQSAQPQQSSGRPLGTGPTDAAMVTEGVPNLTSGCGCAHVCVFVYVFGYMCMFVSPFVCVCIYDRSLLYPHTTRRS